MLANARRLAAPVASLALAATLAACGGSTGGSAGTGTGSGGTNANPSSSGEVATGDAGIIAWTDPQHRYRVDSPGPMTVTADGRASAIKPAERLEVTILTGSRASDPMALAQADLTSLKSSLTNFHQIMSPASVSISGRRMVKMLYEWTAGTNAVTGKPTKLTTARFYIPKDSARLAVMTYGIATNQYDPQGADDEAISFTWLS